MPNRDTDIVDNHEPIDAATSAMVCKGIGERLRQNLVAEASGLPPHLQHLLDQLRLRDGYSVRR